MKIKMHSSVASPLCEGMPKPSPDAEENDIMIFIP